MKRGPRFAALLLGTAVTACAQVTLLNSLTAYYGFDGTAVDGSGNGYNLTLSGGIGFATGLSGQALNPGGNANYYAARTVDDSAFDFGTADFTVQIWVNYVATTNEQVLVEKFTGQTGPGWTLTKLTGNQLAFALDVSNTPIISSPVLSISISSWHQAIIRRTGNNLELFFDGASVAFQAISGATTATTSDPLLVGRRDAADGRGFSTNGSLDELAIWSRSLSNAEITALYNGGTGVALSSIPEPANFVFVVSLGIIAVAVLRRRHQPTVTHTRGSETRRT